MRGGTNAYANRNRDGLAQCDLDGNATTHRNANQHTDADRHRDDYTATQRDRDARAHAYPDCNADARGTQSDAERGANLRGHAW